MSDKSRKTQKYRIARATNIPGSNVGKKRHDLYANAYQQIKNARARGFLIECIALCASIIEDRLEARRQCVYYEEPSKHSFAPLGELLNTLPKAGSSDDKQMIRIYSKIRNGGTGGSSDARNGEIWGGNAQIGMESSLQNSPENAR